jgi:N6-L-threonylcarbamoyladenine synthase
LVRRKPAVDRIAVTEGPGLEPALWVGINFANALAALWNIPAEGANHMEGHIAASLIPMTEPTENFQKLLECPFPAIALLISGGHTEIVLIRKPGDYAILGRTRDDAVGEAFDKVARMLGLPYPGGPEIGNLAEEARKTDADAKRLGLSTARGLSERAGIAGAEGASPSPGRPEGDLRFHEASFRGPEKAAKRGATDTFSLRFPRPMIGSPSLDMSFSGLKTAVLYELKKHEEVTDDLQKEVAREFEDAVTETLVAKLEKAFEKNEAYALVAGGGVMANGHIRAALEEFAKKQGIAFLPPGPGLSGDNALMIAAAAALGGYAGTGPLAAQGGLSFVLQ